MLLKTILLLVIVAATSAKVFYKGYKIYTIEETSGKEHAALKELTKSGKYDFLSRRTVLVKPQEIRKFEHALRKANVGYNVMINDVDRIVKKQLSANKRSLSIFSGQITFTAFHRYHEMQGYMKHLATRYPKLATVLDIGTSFERRVLQALRISTGGNGTRPLIVVDAGIHAREWIAPSVALYLMKELVENSKNYEELLDKVDWIIIPMLNPDGYEYTQDGARLWRKTRSFHKGNSCLGADGNRNFNFHWLESGASNDSCSDEYAGRTAFSEPETRALRDLLLANDIKLYLTLHSYGDYILFPWGYAIERPENFKELYELGESVAAAIKAVAGTNYTVGGSAEVLYPAAGGSDDFAMGVAGVPMSYTIELPGGGALGFDIPEEKILEVCRETIEGFKVFGKYVAEHYG